MLADLARRDGHEWSRSTCSATSTCGAGEPRRDAGGLRALVERRGREPAGSVVYGASFENHPALVARLAERHTLLGNPPDDAARRARSGEARRGAAGRRRSVPADVAHGPRDAAAGCASRCAAAAGPRVRDWRGGRCRRGRSCRSASTGCRARRRPSLTGWTPSFSGLTEQLVGLRAFGVRGYRWCGNVSRAPAGRELRRCSSRRARSARAWRPRFAAGPVRRRFEL